MVTDLNVVRDLDLVIQLDPITDYGIGQGAAVDGRVDTDFDIITNGHTTDLRDFLPHAFFVGKTKAFTAQHCARLNNHALADANIVIKRHAWSQPAAFTDFATRPDKAMRAHRDTGSDARTAFDDGKRTNARRRVNHRVSSNHCRWMNAGSGFGFGIKQMGNPRISQVRIRHNQGITGILFGVSSLEQYSSGLAVDKEFSVLGVGQKAQLSWASLL